MTSADTPIPVVLGIDVEPDLRLTDPARPEPWRGFERLYPFMMELRGRIAERHGRPPQFCWLFRLDPQIAETYGAPSWSLKRYARQVAAILEAGDEVGVHTHAYRWQPTRGTWLVDSADTAWVDHCVRSSFETFEMTLRRPCRAHKFGDRWITNDVVATLEELGARVDLTLEPGVSSSVIRGDECHTAIPVDCAQVLHHPYQPSPQDFRTPTPGGTRRIWLLPLSTWRVPWHLQLPRRLYHRLRAASSGPTPGDESSRATVTIRPGFRPYLFRALVKRLLASRDVAHVALVFRSSDGTSADQIQRIATNMMTLASHPNADRLRFVGPEAALDLHTPRARALHPLEPHPI
jgi:hypothetical protein